MKPSDKAINAVLCRYKRLNPKKLKCLIACSGGADSVALVHCLAKIKDEWPIVVGHVTHDIRPQEETEKDKKCVQNLCKKLELEFRWNAAFPIEKIEHYKNLENAARVERLDSLVCLCRKPDPNASGVHDCFLIATGHNADDQFETLLMKMCRGTGLRGMSGIAEETTVGGGYTGKTLIRPMLSINKEDCYAICKDNGLEWKEDSTNTDETYTRNKLRKQVLPILKELYPNASQHATELASIARSSLDVVSDELSQLWRHEVLGVGDNMPQIITIEALMTSRDVVIYEWLYQAVNKFTRWNLEYLNKTFVDEVIRHIKQRKHGKWSVSDDIKIEVNSKTVKVVYKNYDGF